MKIKVDELQHLLDLKEDDLKNLDTEQLRLLLGVLRYTTRIVQRELNQRDG